MNLNQEKKDPMISLQDGSSVRVSSINAVLVIKSGKDSGLSASNPGVTVKLKDGCFCYSKMANDEAAHLEAARITRLIQKAETPVPQMAKTITEAETKEINEEQAMGLGFTPCKNTPPTKTWKELLMEQVVKVTRKFM